MSRADRLAEVLAERELESLVVTNVVNVVGSEQRDFITDFRYVEQAAREVDGFERVRGRQDLVADVAGRLRGRVGFEDQHMTVRAHNRLSELVPEGVELVPAGGIVEDLRAVKSADELARIRTAAALA